ncbi:MAG: nuclear transport factor 2 family protein [Deltaproteobacteria bacterium]|nr:nuclear transport factor 2 family protein [Deltaproteobacteria bacterium]
MPSPDIEVVNGFSAALDADDFEAASRLMRADCTFVSADKTLEGREAVLAAYDRNSRRARALFSLVRYRSRFDRRLPDGGYRVLMTDELHAGEAVHEYTSLQTLYLSDEGLIYRILWEELPGQREATRSFCTSHGIAL